MEIKMIKNVYLVTLLVLNVNQKVLFVPNVVPKKAYMSQNVSSNVLLNTFL